MVGHRHFLHLSRDLKQEERGLVNFDIARTCALTWVSSSRQDLSCVEFQWCCCILQLAERSYEAVLDDIMNSRFIRLYGALIAVMAASMAIFAPSSALSSSRTTTSVLVKR